MNEFSNHKIYFPKKNSPVFSSSKYPDLQRFAGQLVDTPEKAKAYANGFITKHLNDISGGSTYAEIAELAMRDLSNKRLQEQKQALFQGETLRFMLLIGGYGIGMLSKWLKQASWALIVFSLLLFLTT